MMFSDKMKKMVKIEITRTHKEQSSGYYHSQPAYKTDKVDVDVFVHPSLENDPDLVKLIKTAIKEIQE